MRAGNGGAPTFLSNHAGGILGGISTGQPVVCRFAVKPTSSILTPRASVTRKGAETDVSTKGRTIHAWASAPSRLVRLWWRAS